MTSKSHTHRNILIDQLVKSEILKVNNTKSLSIFTGLASEILAQVEIQKCLNLNCSNEIRINIRKLYDLIESSESHSSTFCDGLSGVGWLILYLDENNLTDIDPDVFLEDIDEFIECGLIDNLNEKNYDLLHGAMGLGLYFLKRKRKDLVEKIIDSLSNYAVKEGNEYKWVMSTSKQSYDFGLAHGQSGVLYFLGKCYNQGIRVEQCKTMISGIFNFYIYNIQSHESIGSFWPSIISTKDYVSGKNAPAGSRLAWCYGDLGILHTLFIVSKWINNKYMNKKAKKMLMITAKRIDKVDTLIQDSYFCHGTSGVACIYHNLYIQTKNKIFKESACYWSNQICKSIENPSISNNEGKKSNLPETGILLGKSGILLTLMTIKNNNTINAWKEYFFLQ